MNRTDGFATLLEQAVANAAVAGAVALAVDRYGTLGEAGAGTRDPSAGSAMSTDTIFWLASMTKAIVSVAAMQLVQQDRLSLDAPISATLPALARPQVLEGFDPAGTALLRPARTVMTLRHLLTHTAGYGYTFWNAGLGRYLDQQALPRIPNGWDDVARIPLLFDPGTGWTYGINTDIAGLAVEAASGETLDAYLRAHVLGPLGMHDTGFLLSPPQRARLARMHRREADGSLSPMAWSVGEGQGFTGGGGGLCGTARDYGRFLRMLLNDGELDGIRVLRAGTVAEMGRNHIGDLHVHTLASAMPRITNDANLFPGMAQKWGLGFLLNTAPGPNGRSTNSLAWAGLGNCYYWVDPERGVAACLLTQILPFADARVLALLGGIERLVYGREVGQV